MKKVILLALLMPMQAYGQIVYDFESQSITNWVQSYVEHWKADTVSHLSGMFSLHHVYDNPDAGTDQIAVSTKNLHPEEGVTRWSFLVRYGYDPSSLNNWSVFLMSDIGPPAMSADGSANGYAVGVNLTGSDDTLRLWKIKGNQVITVVKSRINWQNDIGSVTPVKIIVERTLNGNWTLTVNSKSGNLISTGSGIDNELFGAGWFGIFYRYSSTRDRLLWIDDIDIQGKIYEDTSAPVITGCVATGLNSVSVRLNEEPASGMSARNISLNNGNSAVSVIKKDNLTYLIEFTEKILNKSMNSLIINNICDLAGNCSSDIKYDFTPSWAETGDVVISEIMADPTPEVSLPGKEYLEITNRTEYPVNLKNWSLSTESQEALFPDATLPSLGICVACSCADTALFKRFGRVIGLKQFPSLTDAGRILWISDSTGSFIHGVDYTSEWYNDDLKSNGGWSLEVIDTDSPFHVDGNWTSSVSKNGGTPGMKNSVSKSNPDLGFYGILNVSADDSLTVRLKLSEPVIGLTCNKISITDEAITDISQIDPLYREYLIKLDHPLKRAVIYQLDMPDVFDFAGNRIEKSLFRFGLAERSAAGDILFNELLFNPYPGEADYLEFINNSGKILDASRLSVVSVNETGDTAEPVPLSNERKCILPGEYYAITTDKERILQRFYSADPIHLFQSPAVPSMPDDKGRLILYNRELEKIDELSYDEKMHYSLLSSNEGVALEKTNPVLESQVRENWRSATETSGWGTPGAPNSVFSEIPSGSAEVVFSSTKISPDNDGNEDFLTISLNLQGSGNVVSVTVFDEAGNYIRKIASNLFAGASASLVWDGTAADGSIVRTGIYIILITYYNDSGKTGKWKKVCTVANR